MPEIDIALKFLSRAVYKLRTSQIGNGGIVATITSNMVLLQQLNSILRERYAQAARDAALHQSAKS